MTTSNGMDISKKQERGSRRGRRLWWRLNNFWNFLQWCPISVIVHDRWQKEAGQLREKQRAEIADQTETVWKINKWHCRRANPWWDVNIWCIMVGWACCMIRRRLAVYGCCESLSQNTSIHAKVPSTALLYDIVNAVYTKMYFLWKLWMCTVEQVVDVR